MMEFWNFKDTGIILSLHWFWLLIALGFGVVSGWLICGHDAAP